jgi:hypothetical protein
VQAALGSLTTSAIFLREYSGIQVALARWKRISALLFTASVR